MAHTTEGSAETQILDQYLRQCWCPRIMLLSRPFGSGWPVMSPRAMLLFEPELWLGDMSGSILSSAAPIIIRGIVTTQGLYALLRPFWSLRTTLLLGS